MASVDLERALAEIKEELARERAVHFARDPDAFAALLADEAVMIANGSTTTATRAQNRARFAKYFADVEFLEWDDVEPARITLAKSGDLAVVRVRKRVTSIGRSHTAVPETTLFAWLSVLERRGTQWQVVQVASTREPDLARKWIEESVASLGTQEARARAQTLAFEARVSHGEQQHTLQIAASGTHDGDYRTEAPESRLHYLQLGPANRRVEVWLAGVTGLVRSQEAPAAAPLRHNPQPEPHELASAALRAQVRGHAFASIALGLHAWFSDWIASGSEEFEGHACDRLYARGVDGTQVQVFLRKDTRRLLGIRVLAPEVRDAVTISFDTWLSHAGLSLPERVSMKTSAGLYVANLSAYRITQQPLVAPAWVNSH